MEWYEHDLSGPDYDGPAYARLLVRLAALGLGLGLIIAAGVVW